MQQRSINVLIKGRRIKMHPTEGWKSRIDEWGANTGHNFKLLYYFMW